MVSSKVCFLVSAYASVMQSLHRKIPVFYHARKSFRYRPWYHLSDLREWGGRKKQHLEQCPTQWFMLHSVALTDLSSPWLRIAYVNKSYNLGRRSSVVDILILILLKPSLVEISGNRISQCKGSWILFFEIHIIYIFLIVQQRKRLTLLFLNTAAAFWQLLAMLLFSLISLGPLWRAMFVKCILQPWESC